MRFQSVALLLFSLVVAVPSAALGQVYKWVDENGVVNYGDKPPARGKAVQPLAENGGGSVSVVPGIPKEELNQMRERDMQRRMQQLEREVDELRARNTAGDYAVPNAVPAEVYVPGYAYGYGYGWGSRRPLHPPVAGRPGHRPEHPIAHVSGRPRSIRSSPLEPIPVAPAMRGASRRG